MNAIAHTDGGNRAEFACSAAVLLDADGKVIERHQLFIGKWSNNFAEYHGVLLALNTAIEVGITDLAIFSDSELIVNHLNGVYKCKSEFLRPLFFECLRLASQLDIVEIRHVPRERNQYADCICNVEMDRAMNRPTLKRSLRKLEVVREHPPCGVPLVPSFAD